MDCSALFANPQVTWTVLSCIAALALIGLYGMWKVPHNCGHKLCPHNNKRG